MKKKQSKLAIILIITMLSGITGMFMMRRLLEKTTEDNLKEHKPEIPEENLKERSPKMSVRKKIDRLIDKAEDEFHDREIYGTNELAKRSQIESPDGVKTYLPPKVPEDVPMIELRFHVKDNERSMKPLKVRRVSFGPWESGEIAPSDVEELTGAFSVQDYSLRVGVMEVTGDEGVDSATFRFGRTYHIGYRINEQRQGDNSWYENIFQIPDQIPPGKVAVINLVAKHSWSSLQNKIEELRGEGKEYIKGTINMDIPMPFDSLQARYFPKERRPRRVRVGKDGNFKIEVQELPLGGMLIVMDADPENEGKGTGMLYIESVEKRDVLLPENADTVVHPEKQITFQLNIPAEKITDDLMSVALKVNKKDKLPMGWVNFDRYKRHFLNQYCQWSENLNKTGKVELDFVSGSYYVELLYWPKGKSRKREVIGTVIITDKNEGEVLQVEPL